MEQINFSKRASIAIVGGGKAGCLLLELLRDFPNCQIIFLADLDPKAPAILKAQEAGIPAFTDYKEALKQHQTDILFEVTKSEEVSEDLIKLSAQYQFALVPHNAAFLILSAIEKRTKSIQSTVITEITEIQTRIMQSLSQINELVQGIQTIASEMRIVAINARIEAARAGEHGRGFGVVAQTMGASVDSARELSNQIDQLNQDVQKVVEQIEAAIAKLG